MLDIQSLKIFIAVAEECHFARAADALNVSQSAVSKQLQRLEDKLGMLLVNRGKRAAVSLTRAGALFLNEAHAAVERLEQAERIGRNIGRGEAGPLRLGYIFSAVMAGLVPTTLRGLREKLPGMLLAPMLMETPEQLAAMTAGKIDIGLVRPRPSYPAGIMARIVHRESLIAGMEANHRLARAAHVNPKDFAGEQFIIPQFHEQVGLIDSIRKLARAGGFATPATIQTSDFISAASMAAAGMGVILAPASLSRLHLEGLCYRTIDDYEDVLDIALIHREDTPAAALATILAWDDASAQRHHHEPQEVLRL